MENKEFKCREILKLLRIIILSLFLIVITLSARTQNNVVIPAGSFIVNMGVVPQTVANGLKPYGLVYALLQAKCPVEWVINSSKVKDGKDFTYNGVDYKGGTFIIKAEYRTAAVNTIIANWQALGIVGTTTTAPISIPVYLTFWNAPKWTMDKQNGGIATAFFANAGIPASAYGGSSSTYWKIPADLNCCDDIFVMPHADPIWLTHRRLYDWVGSGLNGCKGGVWLGCHAGSALENMFDNITTDGDAIDASQQTNFLSEKSGPAVGAGPWSTPGNSLILWGSHNDGTLPYTFNNTYASDPVAQYMGSTDAAQLNGSEQIYIPALTSPGWRPQTKVLVYDPDHPQAKSYPSTPMTHVGALLAYGPGFGVEGNGKVFLEAAHNISGTAPANIAAQRAFFNYSFLVAWEKAVLPSLSNLPNIVFSGVGYNLSYDRVANVPPAPGGTTYTTVWSASCGGTFLPNNTSSAVTYIPPVASAPITCNISVTITDDCGRTTFDTHSAIVQCDLQVATSITNPCFNNANGGAISMSITNGNGPYNWSWTKSGGGSGSGNGTTITGLSAGDYVITVIANGGAGCSASFSATLSSSPLISISATTVPVSCNGGSNGAINISVSGGTPGYSYSWSDGATTQNRSGLIAGTYTITVTDSKGCQATLPVIVNQPLVLTITPAVTNVSCYGQNNGTINLVLSGGTSPFTFLWNDGNTLQNRTGLASGTYSVTVTDANNCTLTYNNISVTQPSAALNLSETHVNINCYGASSGSIDLTATGGTAPYIYAWTKTGGTYSATTQDIIGLSAGTYNVLVTDNKGCQASLSVTLTQPVALALSTVLKQPTCPPGVVTLGSDGEINLSVTGGTPNYTFSWTGPNSFASTSQNITGLVAGTYTVTVKDASNCTKTASYMLNYLNPNPVVPGAINH